MSSQKVVMLLEGLSKSTSQQPSVGKMILFEHLATDVLFVRTFVLYAQVMPV